MQHWVDKGHTLYHNMCTIQTTGCHGKVDGQLLLKILGLIVRVTSISPVMCNCTMECGLCLPVTSAWMLFDLIQLCVGHVYHVLESISDMITVN